MTENIKSLRLESVPNNPTVSSPEKTQEAITPSISAGRIELPPNPPKGPLGPIIPASPHLFTQQPFVIHGGPTTSFLGKQLTHDPTALISINQGGVYCTPVLHEVTKIQLLCGAATITVPGGLAIELTAPNPTFIFSSPNTAMFSIIVSDLAVLLVTGRIISFGPGQGGGWSEPVADD